jgi:hypothetical protein
MIASICLIGVIHFAILELMLISGSLPEMLTLLEDLWESI